MIIHSKIPQPKTGFFSLMIWPVVKVKTFIEEVYKGLLSMIWAELFKNEANQFNELTHLIAFFVLSVFAMILYHFEGLEDTIVLTFFGLWILDIYLTKLTRTNRYEHIALEIKDTNVTWKSVIPGGQAIKKEFKQADISQVSLVSAKHISGAFGAVQAQIWKIFIILNDYNEYPIYAEKNFALALKKASYLAQNLTARLEIANSIGNGDYAAAKIDTFNNYRQADSSNLWKIIQTSSEVKIYKKFSVTLAKRIIKSVLTDAGVFLFMVIMAGVMVRFGMLLTFLLGSRIGLASPTFVLHLSFSTVLSFFAPKIDFVSLVILGISIAMLFYSGFQHSKEHRIIINKKRLQYGMKGQTIKQLATQDIKQLILLREPKTALLLVDHSDKCIKIDNLEDEEEGEELYNQILKQLENVKR